MDVREQTEAVLRQQKIFFQSGATRGLKFRRDALTRLFDKIREKRAEIHAALYSDLRKSEFEAFETETSGVLEEILHIRRRLKKWARPRRVPVHLNNLPAKGRIYAEPYGSVLIFSAWNYPFQLAVSPLTAALAAGNCAVLKPAAQAPATAEAIRKLIGDCFEPEHVAVIPGGGDAAAHLLRQRFDYIFYTGGLQAGRRVMLAAAEHLTPVTLELGGKSPCIVAADADPDVTAKRLVWGKFLNAGQTCVAPDYLLVQDKIKAPLLEKIQTVIKRFYGEDPQTSPDYPRIVNDGHFDRLTGLLANQDIFCGGRCDRGDLYIEPTVLSETDAESEIMSEEIFGPILPVITWKKFDEVIEFITARPKPLAMYYFSESRGDLDRLLNRTSAGGVAVNDTVTHFINPSMPFGGVGESGMGAYHGKYGFDTFSHFKPVMIKSTLIDVPVRYPPFAGKLKLLRRLCR
ncbi:MAG: aldehyde dehydrogenase [Victivallales bacterium]|nr:aldehyde dehydrogenase [Victivallales bacterium]